MNRSTPTLELTRPRWRVYLLLGRVSNLPTVWTNCLAGMLLAGGTVRANVIWTTLALSLMYTAGMYLNDAFDQHFDSQFRAERPIPHGDIAASTVYLIGFAMLALGIVIIGVESHWATEPVFWSLLLSLLIVYYNYRHKSDPLSPLVMATCRIMVYFVSAAIVSTAANREILIGALALAGYLIGLTYIAKQENFKKLKSLWPLAFLGLSLIQVFRGTNLIGLLFVGWTLYSLSFLFRLPKKIPAAVVSLIAGIALLDAVTIATAPGHTEYAVVAVVGFMLTLSFQRFVPGT